MSAIDELLARNRTVSLAAATDALPSRNVAVVTCMDARLDLYKALGLGIGEAHILRNAGGLATEDMIRSLAISQRRLGTREVMIIQHTDCGMQKLTDEEFREELERDAGASPEFEAGAFDDLEQSVREGVARIRRSPFLPHRDQVRGFVYDVADGRLHEVTLED